MTSQAYRPDIDGLRAVAVLAVVAFHAASGLLPGGYIGVDIFFVISGYLITGLIAKRIEDNTFSIAGFYTRRIKRIFPAYIVVAVATLAASSWLLIPNDYIFYTTSLAASWAFVSNVFFSMLSWGYFGTRAEEFPLLHTWSLSVEEQFYFFFPVLLIGLYRYARKAVLPVVLVLALVFLAWSEARTGDVKSYFLLTTRAHELLIGALTFFAAERMQAPSRVPATLQACAGMMLMIGSMMLIRPGTSFPGLNSLYPCAGAALLIHAGRTNNPVSDMLRTKPMVFIGLISYSLYLWHWPILMFLRYRQIQVDLSVGIAAVGLSFILAILTWKFVEMPIRQNRHIQFKRAFFQIYALPAAAFVAVGAYSYLTEGAPGRFSSQMRELITSYSFERDLGRTCAIRGEDYRKIDASYLEKNCAFGDMTQAQPQILLMGDSHANHFKPFLDSLAKAAGLKAVFHVQGTCAPTNLPGQVATDESARTCQKRNRDLLALSSHYKYVVLGGSWAGMPADFEQHLRQVVQIIQQAGATPVIMKDNASYEQNLSQCILHRTRGWIPQNTNCNIPYGFVENTQGPPDRIIDRVKSTTRQQVIVVDPKMVMCNSTECLTYIGNMAIYKDSNHINTKAAKFLGVQYAMKVENPFLTDKLGRMNAQAPSFDPGSGTGAYKRR
ncbi:acyltransferase family protein [Massilia sp. LXY-6]|uniref:acyltransferase family protein n=1 Tax=Massilia sp. LXY-6 TaxID=3379823 RepID=UPI003EE285AF